MRTMDKNTRISRQKRPDGWQRLLTRARGALGLARDECGDERLARDLEALEALDDHILADIGISRDELRAARREARLPRRSDWTVHPRRPLM